LRVLVYFAMARIFNRQTRSSSTEVVDRHYDAGNDVYLAFLDGYNQYTCGLFRNTDDLEIAQQQKLDLVCRKLKLARGETLLDIGCGWGGLAKFAAERYGVTVTGISISDQQITYAREFCHGLPVSIEYRDYRDLTGSFDKVVSVGMLEHVGYKNYRSYLETVQRVLKEDGLFLLHTIGGNGNAVATDPWIDKYIFPNGMLPSLEQLGRAIEGVFVMEDWHNLGAHYDKTLTSWSKNLDIAWPRLKQKYDERFYRMWRYYFLMCAGSFRARFNQVWQIVLSKNGVRGGYERIA
jgi:cyclopropane-fatty-acyl-phospholipid synthase